MTATTTRDEVAEALMAQIILFPRTADEVCARRWWSANTSGNPYWCNLRTAHDGSCAEANRAFKFSGREHDVRLLGDLGRIWNIITDHRMESCGFASCNILTAPEGQACEARWLTHRMSNILLGYAEPEWTKWFM